MGWVTEHHPTTDELDACVQCGLCLPVCPTFRLTGRETASPRGRLHAMSAVAAGVVEVDETFAEVIDFCLGCRACEPICPGLVPYGRALEGARAEIDAQLPGRERRNRWTLGTALGSRRTMNLAGAGLSMAQSMGLTRLAREQYKRITGGLRPLRGQGESSIGHVGGPGDSGTVGLLAGCIQDQWFRPVNRAAITLLEKAGYTVAVPERQTCCGALAAHDGKAEAAERYMRQNDDAFGGFDMVVATAAGCSAHLADYRWTGHEPETVDVTVAVARAISDGRLPTVDADHGEIAIQDPCHLRHAQRVIAEPRAVLAAAGYRVVEIDDLALCCGAAGLYTILQPEASEQLGNQKADQIRSQGVMRVASANPGCEMQLRSHLEPEYQIKHPIEWYLESLAAQEKV
ncbi:MAG TPA: (Fe-S)-binding protein [Acidimicrobiia bacterium]|nr:(Fe-S)-binding protein [Acidimicrobiia bacterium]